MSERILRVNSEIQKAISYILANEIKNPLIKGLITVTKVDTTTDLDQSKIYLSIFSFSLYGSIIFSIGASYLLVS